MLRKLLVRGGCFFFKPLSSCSQVFGLHPNADITYQTNLANETLSTIISIQPKDSGGGAGETREASVQRLASEMLEKLPPDYVPHEVGAVQNQLDPTVAIKYTLMNMVHMVVCLCFNN